MQLQVRDVAALFEVEETPVYRWIRAGEIPAHEVNAEYRFSRAELLEWATARHLRVPPALFEGVATVQLAAALEAGGVFRDVPGADLRSALKAVVERLPLSPQTDRASLLAMLISREAAGTTAVGNGIAIPHVRSPLVLATGQATATVCYLATPLDFGAPDGKPVKTLFTLVSPTVRVHLQLLGRLAFALRTPDFRDAVARSADLADLVSAARNSDAGPQARKP